MVNIMFNSKHKCIDIDDNSFINRMNSYCNPYEFNLERQMKDNKTIEQAVLKTKTHSDRQIKK